MTIRQRIEAFQGAEISLPGDSLYAPLFDTYGCAYVLPTLLAAKDSNAKVILRTLAPNTGGLLIPDITIQSGSAVPSQTIRVIRDSWSGSGAVSRCEYHAYLFNFPIHYAGINLGVNDVGQHGTPGHTREDFIACLTALASKARNAAGASQVVVTTPAWYEDSLDDPRSAIRAAYAADVRMLARKNGFDCIDMSKIMEDHYSGVGIGGQGTWFPVDNAHYGAVPHAMQAAEHMRIMGWP